MGAYKNWHLVVYVFLLNIADAVLTHYSVSRGFAKELNPIMDFLLEIDPTYFYICKISLVVLGLTLLVRIGDNPGTRLALLFCALIYTCIIGLHVAILL